MSIPALPRNGLFYRWLVLNAVGVVLSAIAINQGWVALALNSDPTFITHVIFVVSVVGILVSGWKAFVINKRLNDSADLAAQYANQVSLHGDAAKEALSYRYESYLAIIPTIAKALVSLGLIGTVVGIIIGFSGIDPTLIADASSVGPVVAKMMTGLAIAFYTTLVGGIFNVWMTINHFVIGQGASFLIADILEGGRKA